MEKKRLEEQVITWPKYGNEEEEMEISDKVGVTTAWTFRIDSHTTGTVSYTHLTLPTKA